MNTEKVRQSLLKSQRVRDASPDLLAACKAQCDAIDTLFVLCIENIPGFMPSKSAAWPALLAGNAAIAKAEDTLIPPPPKASK